MHFFSACSEHLKYREITLWMQTFCVKNMLCLAMRQQKEPVQFILSLRPKMLMWV
jgi:hypothetical protein